MPRKSPFTIVLTCEEWGMFVCIFPKYTRPYVEVIRAKIVLYAAQGLDNKEIAKRLETSDRIVYKWRKRFFEERMDGLAERPRRGRPPRFPPRSRGRGQGLGL